MEARRIGDRLRFDELRPGDWFEFAKPAPYWRGKRLQKCSSPDKFREQTYAPGELATSYNDAQPVILIHAPASEHPSVIV